MLAKHLHYYYVDGPIVWNLVLNSAFCTDNLQYLVQLCQACSIHSANYRQHAM